MMNPISSYFIPISADKEGKGIILMADLFYPVLKKKTKEDFASITI